MALSLRFYPGRALPGALSPWSPDFPPAAFKAAGDRPTVWLERCVLSGKRGQDWLRKLQTASARPYTQGMKRIFLLRHAEAADGTPALKDRDRPLTEKGREDARLIGDYLARQTEKPGFALCSPALRTRETLDGICARLSAPLATKYEETLYNASAGDILNAIQQLPDRIANVLVVGHNPGFHAFGARLADRTASDPDALLRLAHKFPKGALALFESPAKSWAEVSYGRAKLQYFVKPRELRQH